MGHLRLGRLPKQRRWTAVVELLDRSPLDTAELAATVAKAADARLTSLSNDPTLVNCIWLLTRVMWASRSPDFAITLNEIGLDVRQTTSALTLISRLSDAVQMQAAPYTQEGPFSELASLALRRTLTETIGAQGVGLFGATVDDVQAAFRKYSTRTQFGGLTKRFFADFFARSLRYFIAKEAANHIGATHSLENIAQSQRFDQALDVYARQSARIMEDFAAGWYSKHNWDSKGSISRREARGFVSIAMRKLRMELMSEVPEA